MPKWMRRRSASSQATYHPPPICNERSGNGLPLAHLHPLRGPRNGSFRIAAVSLLDRSRKKTEFTRDHWNELAARTERLVTRELVGRQSIISQVSAMCALGDTSGTAWHLTLHGRAPSRPGGHVGRLPRRFHAGGRSAHAGQRSANPRICRTRYEGCGRVGPFRPALRRGCDELAGNRLAFNKRALTWNSKAKVPGPNFEPGTCA